MAKIAYQAWMGRTLQESEVKAGLRELNPEIHFDMGAALNIWHPYMASRQNVFYRGKSLGGMDRGVLPEVPVWSTRRDMIEVPVEDVRYGEVALYPTSEVLAGCAKCHATWRLPHRPSGLVICPTPCGNMGDATDRERFAWQDIPTGMAQVYRTVRDRVLLVGWRHTFVSVIKGNVPGASQRAIELRFRVDMSPRAIAAAEVPEEMEATVLNRALAI